MRCRSKMGDRGSLRSLHMHVSNRFRPTLLLPRPMLLVLVFAIAVAVAGRIPCKDGIGIRRGGHVTSRDDGGMGEGDELEELREESKVEEWDGTAMGRMGWVGGGRGAVLTSLITCHRS